jgi:hypothetical protein
VRQGRIGGNQVGYGLGLGQVEGPVQKGALGKLAGLGQPGPAAGEQGQNLLDDVVGAVAADFDHVFAGVGVRPPKQGHHHLIQNPVGVADGAEVQGMAELVAQAPAGKDAVGEGNGVGAGEAEHGNGAGAGRRREGYDSVGKGGR